MTPPNNIARRFSRLIFDALESPATVDRNALLTAASSFLDVAVAGDPNGLALARRMAFQAMEWAVCGCPEDYGKLVRASGAFQMHSHIETAVDKMATP
jgi:hypothetical protein